VEVAGFAAAQQKLPAMESHPLPSWADKFAGTDGSCRAPALHAETAFDPLDVAGSALAFRRLLNTQPPRLLPEGLTPGDFAVARKKAMLFDEHDPAVLLSWLQEEADAKYGKRTEIGFRGNQRQPEPVAEIATPRFPRAA
jgi:hypothetical protein